MSKEVFLFPDLDYRGPLWLKSAHFPLIALVVE